MHLSRWKKAVLGIVGAILIGAIGSGLWDVGVKPGGKWLGRAILDVATLGSAAVKDATYREAAKGFHEETGLELYSQIVVLPLVFLLGATTGWLAAYKVVKVPPSSPVREPDDSTIPKMLRRRSLNLLYTVELALLFMLTYAGVQLLELRQANQACTFYSQSMAICRPYIDEHQAQMLASRFAGIQRKADYIGIIDDLRRIAASNQRQLPDYQPW